MDANRHTYHEQILAQLATGVCKLLNYTFRERIFPLHNIAFDWGCIHGTIDILNSVYGK